MKKEMLVFCFTPDHDLLFDYAEHEAMSRASNPYGNGHTGVLIANLVMQ